jgi:hypothetical protein
MDPYTLASDGLCHYVGDGTPLDYDGAWYESSHWESDGYADCVRITCMPDGPDGGRHCIIERLTINRPDDKGLARALESCGATEFRGHVNAEIEACLVYGHYDPNCSDWREASSLGFIILDDGEDAADCAEYARIHGATIATEDDIWIVLAKLVGRGSCA